MNGYAEDMIAEQRHCATKSYQATAELCCERPIKGLVQRRVTKQGHNLTARGQTKRSKARAQGGGESKIKGFAEAGRDRQRDCSAEIRKGKAKQGVTWQRHGAEQLGDAQAERRVTKQWIGYEWRSKDGQWLGEVGHRQDRQGRGTERRREVKQGLSWPMKRADRRGGQPLRRKGG